MANFNTMRAQTSGARAEQIDAGLRAHMNKVYGTMSVGMLITAARHGPFPGWQLQQTRTRLWRNCPTERC